MPLGKRGLRAIIHHINFARFQSRFNPGFSQAPQQAVIQRTVGIEFALQQYKLDHVVALLVVLGFFFLQNLNGHLLIDGGSAVGIVRLSRTRACSLSIAFWFCSHLCFQLFDGRIVRPELRIELRVL